MSVFIGMVWRILPTFAVYMSFILKILPQMLLNFSNDCIGCGGLSLPVNPLLGLGSSLSRMAKDELVELILANQGLCLILP